MKEYEVTHEIFNHCARNQMRDVFIEEVYIEDIDLYVRDKHQEHDTVFEREDLRDGTVVYYVDTAGMQQRYYFTPII